LPGACILDFIGPPRIVEGLPLEEFVKHPLLTFLLIGAESLDCPIPQLPITGRIGPLKLGVDDGSSDVVGIWQVVWSSFRDDVPGWVGHWRSVTFRGSFESNPRSRVMWSVSWGTVIFQFLLMAEAEGHFVGLISESHD
jgi:hypothetical protein